MKNLLNILDRKPDLGVLINLIAGALSLIFYLVITRPFFTAYISGNIFYEVLYCIITIYFIILVLSGIANILKGLYNRKIRYETFFGAIIGIGYFRANLENTTAHSVILPFCFISILIDNNNENSK
jgi:hypothetical protein